MPQALESYRKEKEGITQELDHSVSNVAADAREEISRLHGMIESALSVLDSKELTDLNEEQLTKVQSKLVELHPETEEHAEFIWGALIDLLYLDRCLSYGRLFKET